MKIGRTVRVFVDNKRKELLHDVDENRKIIVSIFYPTDEEQDEAEGGRYMELFNPCQEEFIKRFVGKRTASGQQLSENYLRSIRINTYNDISISSKEALLPVIVFSPGLGMDRDSMIYNIEKLVEEGYIVFTLGHIYDTEFTILPDGKIIEQSEFVANSTFEEKEANVEIRKKDILFLLDELQVINNQDKLIKGRLNLDKLGLIGHSLGGAAVFKAAVEDFRIKAVVMLDGSLQIFNLTEDLLSGKRLNTPFLNFRRGSIDYFEEMSKMIELHADKTSGEEFKEKIIARHQTLTKQIIGQRELFEYLSGYKSFIKLKDSEHLTFTDWPVIHNLAVINGRLAVDKAHEIISNITVRFFNEFLCGMEYNYRSFIDENRSPLISLINKNGESIDS